MVLVSLLRALVGVSVARSRPAAGSAKAGLRWQRLGFRRDRNRGQSARDSLRQRRPPAIGCAGPPGWGGHRRPERGRPAAARPAGGAAEVAEDTGTRRVGPSGQGASAVAMNALPRLRASASASFCLRGGNTPGERQFYSKWSLVATGLDPDFSSLVRARKRGLGSGEGSGYGSGDNSGSEVSDVEARVGDAGGGACQTRGPSDCFPS